MRSDKHKPYTRDDIEKYHNGKLSAKEMHDMEAYALEDPFFADALDGYAATQKNTSDTHLAVIKRFIQSDDAKIISAPSWKNNWLKYVAAASLILFITIGALYFSDSHKHQKNTAISTVSVPELPRYIDTAAVLDKLAATEKSNSAKEKKKEDIAANISVEHKRNKTIFLDADKPVYTPRPGGAAVAAEVAAPADVSEQAFFSEKANNNKDTPEAADRIVIADHNLVKQRGMITTIPQKSEAIPGSLAGRATAIRQSDDANTKVVIRGSTTSLPGNDPLIIINGAKATEADKAALDKKDIASLNILNSKEATAIYGATGANGAIIIVTHSQKKIKKDSANNPGVYRDSLPEAK